MYMEPDYSELEDEIVEPLEEWQFDNEEDFILSGMTKAKVGLVKRLKEYDYSLNAPLIDSELRKLLEIIGGNKGSKSELDNLRLNHFQNMTRQGRGFTPRAIQDYHKWMGGFFTEVTSWGTAVYQEFQNNFYNRAVDDHNLTSEVVRAFLRGLQEKNYIPTDYGRTHSHVLKWGQLFLDFHKITYILNSVEMSELVCLSGWVNGEISEYPQSAKHTGETNYVTDFSLPSVGDVSVGFGLCFLRDQKIILDRNFILHIKDLAAARMHSIMSIYNRCDGEIQRHGARELIAIYKLGDTYLQAEGNDAYSGLALLEPIANEKICAMARMNKRRLGDRDHKVPEDLRFSDHITEAINELSNPHYMREIRSRVKDQDNLMMVLNIFGAYRHWGHPFVDFIKGIDALRERVMMDRKAMVDRQYAALLGSDLAYRVLSTMYKEKKVWYVDKTKITPRCALYNSIQSGMWPAASEIAKFGDKWHELPLIKAFDIPDMIDNSVIYSDKSHSLNLSDLIALFAGGKSPKSIKTCRVLETLLSMPATNWVEFLTGIDLDGLDDDSLVIGLRGKEREMKLLGRYFALMSWKLREYFVVTEYLIKKHFVPLFAGLTMADDLTTVTKKLLDCTVHHGRSDYEKITFANHIDYSKWNNYQSKEANEHVFSVMGKFLGYPTLISRTHEFFEKSVVYYLGAPELLTVKDGQLANRGEHQMTWKGQRGGLEGLRQKGWSITNYLAIERESKACSTSNIKVLAQGDNQIICNTFLLKTYHTEEELTAEILSVHRLNTELMDRIQEGTGKLGLRLNPDETLVSTDYLIYGKIPVFKGDIMPVETKRWSRVTCSTNDQIPNLANVMSTVSSCALTVSQNSKTPVNSMFHMDFLGNLVRRIVEVHNPALGTGHRLHVEAAKIKTSGDRLTIHRASVIYLEPSLGGVSGTSLNRFLIRGFPDPVTESLSFWKIVHDNTALDWLKRLCISAGNPKLSMFSPEKFPKLLENPMGLNISRGVNPQNVIKEAVIRSLHAKVIKNEIIIKALDIQKTSASLFLDYMMSIKPWFPRFFAELKSATIYGISDSVIGLIANSRTIRNLTKHTMGSGVDEALLKSEIRNVVSTYRVTENMRGTMWVCSSSQADKLRLESYGRPLEGTTIPHPSEMFGNPFRSRGGKCVQCPELESSPHMTVHIPQGLYNLWDTKGTLPAYLGSNTSQSTSLAAHWERETKAPFITRALNMYACLNWFVDVNSPLARTIINNLTSLIGEVIEPPTDFKRTGSAVHRFSSDRQSSGGFCAQSSACPRRMFASTDPMHQMDQNYDFMFQSSLIYGQAVTSIALLGYQSSATHHYHIRCQSCVRVINDVQLEAPDEYKFADYSKDLEALKPEGSSWIRKVPEPSLITYDWVSVSDQEKSYHLGRACGYIYGDQILNKERRLKNSEVFPVVLANKVRSGKFLDGLIDGVARASGLQALYRSHTYDVRKTPSPKKILVDVINKVLNHMYTDPGFCSFVGRGGHLAEVTAVGCAYPRSYPMKTLEIGKMCEAYFIKLIRRKFHDADSYQPRYVKVMIFSEMFHPHTVAGIALSGVALNFYYQAHDRFKESKCISNTYKLFLDNPLTPVMPSITKLCFLVRSEIRHAANDIRPLDNAVSLFADSVWEEEFTAPATVHSIVKTKDPSKFRKEVIEKRCDPTIAGCRVFRLSTGAPTKVRSILKELGEEGSHYIVGGDGSGGITSMLVRQPYVTKVIFNSLVQYDGVVLGGCMPGEPPAISVLGPISEKCVNKKTSWQDTGDLCDPEVWKNLGKKARSCGMDVDMIILDMECGNLSSYMSIFKNLDRALTLGLVRTKSILVKCYLSMIGQEEDLLPLITRRFNKADVCWSSVSSSHTSEVYIHCRGYHEFSDRFIDWDNFWSSVRGHPCKSDDLSEFNRALRTRSMNFYKGVPKRFITDPYTELVSMLIGISVPAGDAMTLSELARISAGDKTCGTARAIMQLASDRLICTSGCHGNNNPPPTEGQVRAMMSLHFGYWLWVAWTTRDFLLKKRIQLLIDTRCPFSTKTTSAKIKDLPLVYTEWNFAETWAIKRPQYVDSQAGSISYWFRIWRQCFPLSDTQGTEANEESRVPLVYLGMYKKSKMRSGDLSKAEPCKITHSRTYYPRCDVDMRTYGELEGGFQN